MPKIQCVKTKIVERIFVHFAALMQDVLDITLREVR